MLLLSPDRVVSVDTLIDQVWSGRPPSTARTQVAICIATLRKFVRAAGCTDDVIVTAAPGYMLRATGHRLDMIEFSRLVSRATAAEQDGNLASAAELLREALALWQGRALDGIPASFAEIEATRLDEERMHAVERRMALRLALGEHDVLLGELTALVRAMPFRDRLRYYLMLAQYRSGRRAEALQTFREGSRYSIDELGLDLSTDLQELHDLILRDDNPEAALPTPVSESPRLWTPVAQLPSDIPNFVGRTAELAALDDVLLGRPASSPAAVAYLLGSPGIGKTGLAVRWAYRASRHFPDGQLFADLQENGVPLDVREVLHRFLRAFGVPSERLPTNLGECSVLFRTILGRRRVLIVLDNVADGAQLRHLLPGNGQCSVVVTGRGSLNELMDGCDTVRVRLKPLHPSDSEAMLCGLVRDGRLDAGQAAVRQLAQLCDHVPLALRSSGALLMRKPHWTVEDLVSRLQDRRRRIDELSDGEDSVRIRLDRSLRRLDRSVVRAYKGLSAIEEKDFDVVAGARVLATDLVEAEKLMERLVDAQLLEVAGRDQRGRVRYSWQELLRFHAMQTSVVS